MSSFSEKIGDHLLGSASCANNFCWIWFILKHPYSQLLFTFGLMRLNSRFITCQDVIDVCRSTAIVFLGHFFLIIDTSFFLSDWQILWDPKRTNFFDSQIFMQYFMLVPSMPKVVSISRYVTWRSCNNSWRTASMVSGTTTVWPTFTKFVWEWSTILAEFIQLN